MCTYRNCDEHLQHWKRTDARQEKVDRSIPNFDLNLQGGSSLPAAKHGHHRETERKAPEPPCKNPIVESRLEGQQFKFLQLFPW